MKALRANLILFVDEELVDEQEIKGHLEQLLRAKLEDVEGFDLRWPEDISTSGGVADDLVQKLERLDT